MNRFFISPLVTLALLGLMALAEASENPKVMIQTSLGNITLLLNAENAPITVKNFLGYVDAGHYNNVIFHRVIEGFMIQSGGHLADMTELESRDTIYNEAANGLHNLSGSIAMAREDEIDSATRQFFINTVDNLRLDHSDESCSREDEQKQAQAAGRGLYRPVSCLTYGYAVFGRVIEGMDVVRAIESRATGTRLDFDDVPLEAISIVTIKRLVNRHKDS